MATLLGRHQWTIRLGSRPEGAHLGDFLGLPPTVDAATAPPQWNTSVDPTWWTTLAGHLLWTILGGRPSGDLHVEKHWWNYRGTTLGGPNYGYPNSETAVGEPNSGNSFGLQTLEEHIGGNPLGDIH